VSPVRFGLLLVLSTLVAAPTAGDIGGCGGTSEPLDAPKYFRARAASLCGRCRECGLATAGCRRACDPRAAIPNEFPIGCRPVEHDGQVCLRAVEALGCGAFEGVVDDPPIVPTECDFCPAEAP
jgi:hypothetical protein